MTHEKKLRLLYDLYARIPDTPCAQCGNKCCKTPFHVSDFEKSLLDGNNFDTIGTCAFLSDGKCTVYERRPFICRVYNANRRLGCNEVERKDLMTDAEVIELYHEYYTLFWNVESLRRWNVLQRQVMAIPAVIQPIPYY